MRLRFTVGLLLAASTAVAAQTPPGALAGSAGATTLASAYTPSAADLAAVPRRCRARPVPVLCGIHAYRRHANRYRERMGLDRIPYHWIAERRTTSDARRYRILHYWRRVALRARHRYHVYVTSPWAWFYSSGASCVHGKEGGWHETSLSGPPYYYGGFQYDTSTWLATGGGRYAPRADLASPLEQVIITRAKVMSEGWGAWPSTARKCGLL